MSKVPLDVTMMKRIGELKDDLAKMTAWGRGLEHDKRLLQEENARLKAEVERLTSDLQMEKENEDRLVREWQKANNEVYGLKTQVAALIDDQTRLKEELAKSEEHNEALCERIQDLMAEIQGLESTWPRDPHHGGKVYDFSIPRVAELELIYSLDPLIREAVASAKLARKGGQP